MKAEPGDTALSSGAQRKGKTTALPEFNCTVREFSVFPRLGAGWSLCCVQKWGVLGLTFLFLSKGRAPRVCCAPGASTGLCQTLLETAQGGDPSPNASTGNQTSLQSRICTHTPVNPTQPSFVPSQLLQDPAPQTPRPTEELLPW